MRIKLLIGSLIFFPQAFPKKDHSPSCAIFLKLPFLRQQLKNSTRTESGILKHPSSHPRR
jgi:hypothetical protein